MGHRLRVVSVSFFPYMAYEKESAGLGGPITPTDSVDARLLSTVAKKFNISFEIFEEPTRGFGLAKDDGKFNGMVGFLQREEADFCTMLGDNAERLRVMDYIRTCPSQLMTITSLKPPFFPQHSAFIRPFEKEVWASLLVGVVAWGIVFWVLQQFWVSFTSGPRIQFSKTLLYGWGALLEQPPPDPSVSLSGQVFDADAGLKEVLKGGFSLIDFENYIRIIIASRYTADNGYTPFFTSKKGFSITSAFGWGFRKGAPNYEHFRRLIHGLEDTGIIKYWIADVIDHKVKKTRATGEMADIPDLTDTEMVGERFFLF
ncbi:hypothetical protein Pmani_011584 [Petrolisthes manimaculis]|uniref:Uncharacterized protein n=1 Tax=Petrolisthes manimaculis TaxID=1843537 RepID=A0AAE1Q0S9_9EUCA|nr:hypothetical protein Pmani_011584 [Petrolisthes manimaculis]